MTLLTIAAAGAAELAGPAAAVRTRPAAAASTSPPGSLPATRPELAAEARLIAVNIPGRAEPAVYRLHVPATAATTPGAPLLIALHGTDDDARQALEFWSARHARLPLAIAAPQAAGRGWSSDDLPAIRTMLEDLRTRVHFDPQRVFLAGFSAGGALAFELLYVEALPASAVAALANYLPPDVTDAQIRTRGRVPVFYAVGMADVNHEAMRVGLERLRAAGADVELYRPRIGHVLDSQVGQAALDWFFDRSARTLTNWMDGCMNEPDVGHAAARLEGIIAQAAWHEPAHVESARRVLVRLEASGRADLEQARGLLAAGRAGEAIDALINIEGRYAPANLGVQARTLRERIEADPQVAQQRAEQAARQRANDALALYAGARRLESEGKLAEAALRCRQIIDYYGDTPAAESARSLLRRLKPEIP